MLGKQIVFKLTLNNIFFTFSSILDLEIFRTANKLFRVRAICVFSSLSAIVQLYCDYKNYGRGKPIQL